MTLSYRQTLGQIMGQRLVVSVYKNKSESEPIMSIYYHWSAYTVSALIESSNIIKSYQERKKSIPLEAGLILSMEEIGTRIDPQDSTYIQKLYPDLKFNTEDADRNLGLIAMSRERIEQQLNWAEGLANVYLEEEEIINDCVVYYENEEDYNAYIMDIYVDDDDEDVVAMHELSLLEIDPTQLNMKDVAAFIYIINNNHKGEYAFRLKDDSVIEFIC
jgi:hypothetical protein